MTKFVLFILETRRLRFLFWIFLLFYGIGSAAKEDTLYFLLQEEVPIEKATADFRIWPFHVEVVKEKNLSQKNIQNLLRSIFDFSPYGDLIKKYPGIHIPWW